MRNNPENQPSSHLDFDQSETRREPQSPQYSRYFGTFKPRTTNGETGDKQRRDNEQRMKNGVQPRY